MLEKLFPDIYIKSIAELPIEELKKRGIKALVFDIDNTISPYDVAEPDDDALALLDKLKDEGFKICLLSNNKEQRIKLFNKKIGAYAYWDQVFTDMWCGHNAGLLSIMTAPICERDQLITKVKRPLEKFVMSIYFKKRGKK